MGNMTHSKTRIVKNWFEYKNTAGKNFIVFKHLQWPISYQQLKEKAKPTLTKSN